MMFAVVRNSIPTERTVAISTHAEPDQPAQAKINYVEDPSTLPGRGAGGLVQPTLLTCLQVAGARTGGLPNVSTCQGRVDRCTRKTQPSATRGLTAAPALVYRQRACLQKVRWNAQTRTKMLGRPTGVGAQSLGIGVRMTGHSFVLDLARSVAETVQPSLTDLAALEALSEVTEDKGDGQPNSDWPHG